MARQNILNCISYQRSIPTHIFFVVLVAVSIQIASANDSLSKPASSPVCALVDKTNLPISGLIEASLLSIEGLHWVERTRIDELVKEQELQSAFGAADVRTRALLGQLLKADVLILLRQAKKLSPDGKPILDVVICETKRGLRLTSVNVDSGMQAEEILTSLTEIFHRGLKKYSEQIDTIVAVPPFIDDGLGTKFNYLQATYAKLVEEALLQQPGLLVVELREAQAIGLELDIAPSAKRLSNLSQRPFFLEGRFRKEVTGAQQSIQLSLRLSQSDRQIASYKTVGKSDTTISQWMVSRLETLLPQMKRQRQTLIKKLSLRSEAQRIAALGNEFLKIGGWREALSLYEASLLFDPQQPEMRRAAVVATTRLMQMQHPNDLTLEQAKVRFTLYQRGLEHLEIYLSTADDLMRLGKGQFHQHFVNDFEQFVPGSLLPGIRATPEVKKYLTGIRRTRTYTYLRIALMRANAKKRDFTHRNSWLLFAVKALPSNERYPMILRIAERLPDWPDLSDEIVDMTFQHHTTVKDEDVFHQFLDQLSQSQNPAVRDSGVRIEQQFKKELARAETANTAPPSEPVSADERLKPLSLSIAPPSRIRPRFFMPIRQGLDLCWNDNAVCLLRKSTNLEALCEFEELSPALASPVYDGRYVWLAGHHKSSSTIPVVLIAIDPDSGKHWTFGTDKGLPQLQPRRQNVKLAPIAPGKILVVGNSKHSWAAIAALDSRKEIHLNIFFEAREFAEGNDQKQASNPHIAFSPTFAATLRPPSHQETKPSECVIVVGRNSGSQIVLNRPLLIDPNRRTATVAPFELSTNNLSRSMTHTENAIYVLEPGGKQPRLMRIHYPGTKKEEFIKPCPQGFLIHNDQGLNIIGKQWWVADLSTKNVETRVRDVAWHFRNFLHDEQYANGNFHEIDLQDTSMLDKVYSSKNYGPILVVKKKAVSSIFVLNDER